MLRLHGYEQIKENASFENYCFVNNSVRLNDLNQIGSQIKLCSLIKYVTRHQIMI